MSFNFFKRGLKSVAKRAANGGLAAAVLDGVDVARLISEERNIGVLTEALYHARHFNEPSWMEACAHRLAELDPVEGKLRLASVLASEGKLQEAEDVLAAIAPPERTRDLYIQTQAVLFAKRGRVQEAMDHFDRLPGSVGKFHPVPVVLPTAEEMLQDSPLEHSLSFVSHLRGRYPDHLLIRSVHVRCLAYKGDIDHARELADIAPSVLAEAPEYERRRMREAMALILSLKGWNNELLDYARDVIAEDPTHWSMYYQASEAAAFGVRRNEFDKIMGELQARKLTSPEANATLCRWMIDKGRIDEAKVLLARLRHQSASSFLSATLYLNISHGSGEEVDAAFKNCMRCGILPIGPVTAYCMYLYYFSDQRPAFQQALDVLDRHRIGALNNPAFWQLYLRCLLAVDRNDDARTLYEALPPGLQSAAKLQPFAMYFQARNGKHAEARTAWMQFVRTSKHVCANGRTSYPQTVNLRYQERPGSVLAFANVYNGIHYLDWFLDHYRTLGVDHFFITDNASSDGTRERLAQEPDVSFFSNASSFANSAFGIVWTNHQLQRFGIGHWCFHVDIDEAFVFPGNDRGRSLGELLSYFDGRGFGGVSATEVDMYPEQLDATAAAADFAAHRYFDTDYSSVGAEMPPYVLVRGGLRRRMTKLALTMTKMPLARVTPDFRYVECNHYTTHVAMADVTAALLHYKFVGDVAKRLTEAIDRGVHFGDALAYRRLRNATQERGWGKPLVSEFSRVYDGAKSLEAAGLIRTSPGWENGAAAR